MPHMDPRLQVGSNLRRYRNLAALTQEELAAQAQLDRTYISDIERGVTNPSLMVLVSLASAVGVHPAMFLLEEAAALALTEIIGARPGQAPSLR